MQLIFILLLGWGGDTVHAGGKLASAAAGPIPISQIIADVDSRCGASLLDIPTLARAKRADRRVLIVDDDQIHQELYAAYLLHLPKPLPNAPAAQTENREIFVYNAFGIDAGIAALQWASDNGLTIDVVFTAGVFPETDAASQSSDPMLVDLFTPVRGPMERVPTGTPAFGLITQIRRQSPRTRVIALSAWTQNAVMLAQRRLDSLAVVLEPHVWHELLIRQEDMLAYVFAEAEDALTTP